MDGAEIKDSVTVRVTSLMATCPHCGWPLGMPPPLRAQESAVFTCPYCLTTSEAHGPLEPIIFERIELQVTGQKEVKIDARAKRNDERTTEG